MQNIAKNQILRIHCGVTNANMHFSGLVGFGGPFEKNPVIYRPFTGYHWPWHIKKHNNVYLYLDLTVILKVCFMIYDVLQLYSSPTILISTKVT